MFLKVASDVITSFLFVFLDLMFTKDIFPNNRKVAKTILVFKSGSKLDINNYIIDPFQFFLHLQGWL